MAKVGRPRKEIDITHAEKLAKNLCTQAEIADFFSIDVDTLNARIKDHYGLNFSGWYKRYTAEGRIALRRMQFRAAKKGSVPMLVWLGKQILGQNDKPSDSDLQSTLNGGMIPAGYKTDLELARERLQAEIYKASGEQIVR